jgi:formylglycine-generating enzyme required for sulfatase activity
MIGLYTYIDYTVIISANRTLKTDILFRSTTKEANGDPSVTNGRGDGLWPLKLATNYAMIQPEIWNVLRGGSSGNILWDRTKNPATPTAYPYFWYLGDGLFTTNYTPPVEASSVNILKTTLNNILATDIFEKVDNNLGLKTGASPVITPNTPIVATSFGLQYDFDVDGISDTKLNSAYEFVFEGITYTAFHDLESGWGENKPLATWTIKNWGDGNVPIVTGGDSATINLTSIPGLVSFDGRQVVGSDTYKDQYSATGAFPQGRTVDIPAFKLAAYETTAELWYTVQQWAEKNGYTFSRTANNFKPNTNAAKQKPVTGVTWYDVIVWCNAYSSWLKKGPVYKAGGVELKDATRITNVAMDTSANGYRLPTEAEWEYAARKRNDTLSTDDWAGTNDTATLSEYAWYSTNSSNAINKVGSKKNNLGTTTKGSGLFDMSGNVSEWCWDWHVASLTSVGSTGPISGTLRVVRGGNYAADARGVSLNYRDSAVPSTGAADTLGFRVASNN